MLSSASAALRASARVNLNRPTEYHHSRSEPLPRAAAPQDRERNFLRNNTPMIQNFMTPTPVTVNDGLTLSDALDRMYANNIHHMPVTNPKHGLVGTISADDISLAVSARGLDPDETPVREAMQREPYTCELVSPLVDVVHRMEREHLGSVVVTESAQPVGIFTTTDALRTLRSQLVGYPVEPAIKPPAASSRQTTTAADELERTSSTRHPIKPSVRVHRNHGTLPSFRASLS